MTHILSAYLPNFRIGNDYLYNGSISTIEQRRGIRSESFTGYVTPYIGFCFKRKMAVFFCDSEKIFIDYGTGAAELIPSGTKVYNFIFWRKIIFQTSDGQSNLKVFTPPWRYLLNDGMFPEDIEPVIHLIEMFTNPTERVRFITRFTTGQWPEET